MEEVALMGWTIAYFVIALLFGVWGFTVDGAMEPALIAGGFFASIGVANLFFDRIG